MIKFQAVRRDFFSNVFAFLISRETIKLFYDEYFKTVLTVMVFFFFLRGGVKC